MPSPRTLQALLVLAGALSCAPPPPPSADGGVTTPAADAGDGHAPKTGEKGGACYGNGACNAGLECRDDICAEPGSGGQGEEGGACYGNDTCTPGLECRDDVCTAPSSGEEGEEGGACYGNGTCNPGFECRDDVCTAPSSGEEGGEGGACYGNGTCNPGLVCEADVCVNSSPPDGGPDGGDDSGSPPSAPVITSFTADDDAVHFGAHTTLRWTTSGALSCTIPELGQLLVNGNKPVTPTASTVYELTCSNAEGSSSATVSVDLLPPTIDSFEAAPATIDYGASAALSWTSTGAATCTLSPDVGDVSTSGGHDVSPTEDTAYELTCSHPEGSDTATLEVTVNPPVAITSFTSSAETAPLRKTVTLSWVTENATSCALDGESVEVTGSADVTVTAWPDEVNTYTLTCEGVAGPAEATVNVTTAAAVTYDGDIVICGDETICSVEAEAFGDLYYPPAGSYACPAAPACTPQGTLQDLSTANIVTGVVVLSGLQLDPQYTSGLIEAGSLKLQDVTSPTGELSLPSLRSVEDDLSIGFGGISGENAANPGDVAAISFPTLEDVGGLFSIVDANPALIAAPLLHTVENRLWLWKNDAKCMTLQFPALATVGGRYPPSGLSIEFNLTDNRTATFVDAFPALTAVNGKLRVLDDGVSQAALEAAFPSTIATGSVELVGSAAPTCP